MIFQTDGIAQQMNRMGSNRKPFVFLIDFLAQQPVIFPVESSHEKLLWKTPLSSNFEKRTNPMGISAWKRFPVSYDSYRRKFNKVMQHISSGDTYLLNLTQPTRIETNLGIEDIFYISNAPYKILLKNRFVCFSPEPFVKINNGQISSFPMKGTIAADKEDATGIILSDKKELAEHNTIVDLIRNDLSLVANHVRVENFRYLERIHTNQHDLWQVSSKITGELASDYHNSIGDIICTMLPAGSVTGAPKKKTVDIILGTEEYERGFYTGIFGYFDGTNLDSCVLIRFIENINGGLMYKSGGGITFMSHAENEYEELLKKVYVPVV